MFDYLVLTPHCHVTLGHLECKGNIRPVGTINNLNKFLLASVRRCFGKFLKNTGGFGSFWAFLWLRFEIQVSAIRVDYFEP